MATLLKIVSRREQLCFGGHSRWSPYGYVAFDGRSTSNGRSLYVPKFGPMHLRAYIDTCTSFCKTYSQSPLNSAWLSN